jgi:hypothetical protein
MYRIYSHIHIIKKKPILRERCKMAAVMENTVKLLGEQTKKMPWSSATTPASVPSTPRTCLSWTHRLE